MSSNLEDRLSGHLHSRVDANDASAPSALPAVRKLARRRTMRQRAVVGFCGLAALAGAASFVPRGEESNALITAADPTSVEEEPTTQPTPPSANVAQQDESDPTLDEREPTTPPPFARVIGDGQGGFVAVSVTTSTGRTSFVRSDDGRDWYKAGDVQVDDGRYFLDMQLVDGYFVAITDEQRANPSGGGYVSPRIAVSKDLVDWTVLDIERGTETAGQLMMITDIALAESDITISAIESPWADPADYDTTWVDVCGGSRTDGQWAIATCSGDVLPVAEDLSLSEGSRFFSGNHRDGQALVEVDGPPTEAVLDFYGGSTIEALSTDDEMLMIETAPSGDRVTLVRVGAFMASLLQHDDETTTGEFPEAVMLDPNLPVSAQLEHGPAGWAALITNARHGFVEIENEAGWTLAGTPGTIGVDIVSPERDEFYWYYGRGMPLAANKIHSLFGDIRYFRPGTSDVVFELDGDAVRTSQAKFAGGMSLPPASEFAGELNFGGWILRGDPIRGPLALTSPEGIEQVFTDGFAFVNNDSSDGVEADFLVPAVSTNAWSVPMGSIQFFAADGSPTVRFGLDAVAAALVPAVDGEPASTASPERPTLMLPGPRPAWIVHSPDGIEWDVIEEIELPETRRLTLAVGDDEVLLVEPSGLTRINLDE